MQQADQEFSKWMEDVRIEKGFLSQADLARAMNWNQGMLSRIESGKRSPTPAFLVALAAALKINTDVVLARAGLGRESEHVNDARRQELLSEFDQLSDEDQERMLLVARAFKKAESKAPTATRAQPALRTKKV